MHAGTKGFHGLHEPSQVLLVPRLRLKLVEQPRSRVEVLLHRLTPAPVLFQRHDLVHIGLRETLHLALEAVLPALQLRAARL